MDNRVSTDQISWERCTGRHSSLVEQRLAAIRTATPALALACRGLPGLVPAIEITLPATTLIIELLIDGNHEWWGVRGRDWPPHLVQPDASFVAQVRQWIARDTYARGAAVQQRQARAALQCAQGVTARSRAIAEDAAIRAQIARELAEDQAQQPVWVGFTVYHWCWSVLLGPGEAQWFNRWSLSFSFDPLRTVTFIATRSNPSEIVQFALDITPYVSPVVLTPKRYPAELFQERQISIDGIAYDDFADRWSYQSGTATTIPAGNEPIPSLATLIEAARLTSRR